MSSADVSAKTQVVFPCVITDMNKYEDQLTDADRHSVAVDGAAVLGWYASEMTGGIAYQRFISSEENLSSPNALTRANFEAARRISSLGWSYDGVEHLIGVEMPELVEIPLDADFLDTRAYDALVGEMVRRLCETRGIKIANATKLLHQKRPGLIPVLDAFARQAVGCGWGRSDTDPGAAQVTQRGMDCFRKVAQWGDNLAAVETLRTRAATDPTLKLGTPTRLRVLDILAWGVIRQNS
jgi:hypothetical protein